MKVEEARQERLTIKNFCLAAVALRTPNDSPKTEDYLTLSSLPTQTQQIQQAPFLQWEDKRDDPTVQRLLLSPALNSASSAWMKC